MDVVNGKVDVPLQISFWMLDAERFPEGDNGQFIPQDVVPDIRVEGLNFAYPDDPETLVLQDVSFELPAGQTLGIFGKTGSGKSTLLRVLSRMYAPDKGMVTVNDVDICDLDIYGWRSKLSTVPQRRFVGDSVRSNIALCDDSDPEKLERAIQLASLPQDLPSPNGIDTVVGDAALC